MKKLETGCADWSGADLSGAKADLTKADLTGADLKGADFPDVSKTGIDTTDKIGMRRRGASAYSIIKQEFALKGNKQKILEQFTALLISKGFLHPSRAK